MSMINASRIEAEPVIELEAEKPLVPKKLKQKEV